MSGANALGISRVLREAYSEVDGSPIELGMTVGSLGVTVGFFGMAVGSLGMTMGLNWGGGETVIPDTDPDPDPERVSV
ncbi:Uncharacterised protein [Zhongshania aliphaticivorans]|uniref:Uncharacterized protein n=1 Tax=Zhongshania aliphaticivorans TaxID=1470434 RepID=A0A5S9PML0_9GAMM|nr:hypothetical protein [Zhongshania aliphaticivorans]CAA0105702.1 Uncharacterised protein [Zhongshania aliphaticivorans]